MQTNSLSFQPLAAKMRPKTLDEFVGQSHLLGEQKPLRLAIEQGVLHSMILWGPPGSGKTTLAKILAQHAHAQFENLSAVLAGVKDIRAVVDRAKLALEKNEPTILFVDEVHRFNKAQQDAFLPFVEDGALTFIGATTENPSFALNNALLSRTRVYVLKRLLESDLLGIVDRALAIYREEMNDKPIFFEETLKEALVLASDGDARRALNFIEVAMNFAKEEKDHFLIDKAMLEEVLSASPRQFDNKGEAFYDLISALHKSVRGSDPDAALYWFSRMIDGGCDPLYVARRVVRMASEDVGNADPRALSIALNAWETFERLGAPEGELAIAQAIVYLSVAPKSNAVYTAYSSAMSDVKQNGSLPIPLHLRNAPTKLMRSLDYGKHYRYAHDEPNAYAIGENYFPEEMEPRHYYHPVDRGLEIKIKEKLERLSTLNQKEKK